jgi:hypothetical protein
MILAGHGAQGRGLDQQSDDCRSSAPQGFFFFFPPLVVVFVLILILRDPRIVLFVIIVELLNPYLFVKLSSWNYAASWPGGCCRENLHP